MKKFAKRPIKDNEKTPNKQYSKTLSILSIL